METIITKRGTWNVDSNIKNIIGHGAYGTVHKGTDEKGTKIAVKRIDTKQKKGLSGRIKDLNRLMELDHPNIVRVHDIHQEEGIVWIFMELCEHGDLDNFLRTKTLTDLELVTVMEQIAKGVSYLHARDIIHRDIKPANILVSSDSPIQVKLTDFDVSKFLDEFVDTSAMSTNAGTTAFKAPEFFIRTKDGKLRYHRKVDEYAVGLTYLAMLQKNGQNKSLIPQIETSQDDSELHLPIGQLISERIISKMKEHNITALQEDKEPSLMKKFSSLFIDETSVQAATVTEGSFVSTEVRKLIQKLTCVIPEDRLSAAEVTKELRKIALKEKFRDMKLDRTSSWKTEMHRAFTMCVVGDQLLVRGKTDEKVYILVFNRNDGQVVRDIRCQCDHIYRIKKICKHPRDNNYMLEPCSHCKQIRCYNINMGEAKTVYRGAVQAICPGPSGSVLCVDGEGCIEQLDTQGEGQEFKVKHSVRTNVGYLLGMCYVEQYNIVVFTCHSPDRITAVSLSDGSPLWEFKQQVEGKKINPRELCHDDDGCIYVTDLYNRRILVLEPQKGQLLQVLLVNESYLEYVCWTNSPPQLSVLHGYQGESLSIYDVKY